MGESGTGKETVAQQIHRKSERMNEEFVAFNCASVNQISATVHALGISVNTLKDKLRKYALR